MVRAMYARKKLRRQEEMKDRAIRGDQLEIERQQVLQGVYRQRL